MTSFRKKPQSISMKPELTLFQSNSLGLEYWGISAGARPMGPARMDGKKLTKSAYFKKFFSEGISSL